MHVLYDVDTGRVLGRALGTEPNSCEVDSETWGGICADITAFRYDSGQDCIIVAPEYVVPAEVNYDEVQNYLERMGAEIYIQEIDAHISLSGDFAHGLMVALTLKNGHPFVARSNGIAAVFRMDDSTCKAIRKAIGDHFVW